MASFGSCPTAWLLEGLCSCATVPLLERIPFPTARPWAGCASGLGSWLLPLAPPPLGDRLLFFRWGCRRVWLLVVVGLFWGGGEQKVFVFLVGLALVFFVKDSVI